MFTYCLVHLCLCIHESSFNATQINWVMECHCVCIYSRVTASITNLILYDYANKFVCKSFHFSAPPRQTDNNVTSSRPSNICKLDWRRQNRVPPSPLSPRWAHRMLQFVGSVVKRPNLLTTRPDIPTQANWIRNVSKRL